MWSRARRGPPPPYQSGNPPVVWGLVGGNRPLSFHPPSGCGGWESDPSFPPCGVGSGGWESSRAVLGSLGGVESVLLPEWGLLVVVKLLHFAKPYSVGEDFVLRLWESV